MPVAPYLGTTKIIVTFKLIHLQKTAAYLTSFIALTKT